MAQVLAVTRGQAPPNGTHWSTGQLARRLGVSQSAVCRIWRAFRVPPHQAETFTRSPPDAGRAALLPDEQLVPGLLAATGAEIAVRGPYRVLPKAEAGRVADQCGLAVMFYGR